MKKNPTITITSSLSSSSDDDFETSLSKPLLSSDEKKKCNHSNNNNINNNNTDDVSSKSRKLMEQIQVHRLTSFLCGSMTGIILQMISVFLFTKLIIHAQHHTQELLAENPNLVTQEPISPDATPRETQKFIMNLGHSQWYKVSIWTIYHLSLGVYLIIWFAMMTLAISKVGWKFISSGLRIPERVTRRTCFLRTFFFINGFVQGSLIPWIFLEMYLGNPGFDIYWMPTTHLIVFFAVVFIYDWMNDDVSNKCRSYGDDENDGNNDHNDKVDDDDYDDDINYLV